jgi:hypothetical protein
MARMANIASLLKAEISRVARKQVRADTLGLKKVVGVYRAEIAALKRRAQALELELRRLSKAYAKAVPVKAQAPPAQTLWYSVNTQALQSLLAFLYAERCTRNKAIEPQAIVCCP